MCARATLGVQTEVPTLAELFEPKTRKTICLGVFLAVWVVRDKLHI